MLGDFVLEVIGKPMMQEVSMMDRAASAGFEGIAQMLLEQKKLMDALERCKAYKICKTLPLCPVTMGKVAARRVASNQ